MEGFLTKPSPIQEPPTEAPTEAAEPSTEKVEDAIWYAFYNLSLLRDNDVTNDYNFGYSPFFNNPFEDNRTVEFYHNDLKNRMLIDPALAAAEMGACDYSFGTRFIGEYYDQSQNYISAMNLAKTKFMKMDRKNYLAKLDRFFEFINSLDRKIEWRRGSALRMNPFTVSGIPDIEEGFVEGEGWKLVYTFYTNAQALEVALRIDCGYPPVIIADVVEPTTQSVPEPQPETTTKQPETTTKQPETTTKQPETTTKQPETTTKQPETTTYDKDPEKASYEFLEPNEESPDELPQNSSYFSSYEEYEEAIKEMNDNPAG